MVSLAPIKQKKPDKKVQLFSLNLKFMAKKIGLILLYTLIVVASIFIVFRRYQLLESHQGNQIINYILIALFVGFTYINLKKLIKLIKEAKK
ncbi:MAG: hypothetical protein RBT46_00665 [Weeksellaceae bacterium]|jgi:hypothetical protein|nr:hypothetical protein [Weeksellaceae bacterium]